MKKIISHLLLAFGCFIIFILILNYNSGVFVGKSIPYIIGFGLGASTKYFGYIILASGIPILILYFLNKNLWSESISLIWGVTVVCAVLRYMCII
jgi:4-amino-4-deoxy-L-arabinose transferase-like glycosyltransferase